MKERKHYLDNIRWITILIVIVYHIIYLFNCSGLVSNINVRGIPEMDSFLIFVYPWFMCLLFLISGISSRYSLQKRTNKEFLKDRAKRILLPSVFGMFIYGWIAGFITDKYVNMFSGEASITPGIVRYIIYSLMGIGPLWYCHVLIIASVLILIIRKIDKNDKIWNLCKNISISIVFLLVIAIWGSSYILNMPIITVYRFGIYLLMFLLGYYIFSHDEIMEKLEKICVPLGIISFISGIAYVMYNYGTNYTNNSCLQSIFTNTYLWISILAILGLGKRYLNFNNKFTIYMTKNNFNIYILHYTVVLILGYIFVTYTNISFMLKYILILVYTIIILPVLIEIVKRIPILNKLVFGIYDKK